MKNLEIKTIEHKGIKVTMKIDYNAGEASLVQLSYDGKTYFAKQWVFANRGLEYMNGWLVILEAMTVAVKECKKELEVSLAQASAIKEEKIISGVRAIAAKKAGR